MTRKWERKMKLTWSISDSVIMYSLTISEVFNQCVQLSIQAKINYLFNKYNNNINVLRRGGR